MDTLDRESLIRKIEVSNFLETAKGDGRVKSIEGKCFIMINSFDVEFCVMQKEVFRIIFEPDFTGDSTVEEREEKEETIPALIVALG